MHYQILMGVVDRIAHRPEQREPLRNRETPRLAMLVDGNPFNVIHDEVRSAILGRAAVQQHHDVGDQDGQRLALPLKAPPRCLVE